MLLVLWISLHSASLAFLFLISLRSEYLCIPNIFHLLKISLQLKCHPSSNCYLNYFLSESLCFFDFRCIPNLFILRFDCVWLPYESLPLSVGFCALQIPSLFYKFIWAPRLSLFLLIALHSESLCASVNLFALWISSCFSEWHYRLNLVCVLWVPLYSDSRPLPSNFVALRIYYLFFEFRCTPNL